LLAFLLPQRVPRSVMTAMEISVAITFIVNYWRSKSEAHAWMLLLAGAILGQVVISAMIDANLVEWVMTLGIFLCNLFSSGQCISPPPY
jgi:hypothetical protein